MNILKLKDIPGIAGIDTRKLTRIIRQNGTMKGTLCQLVTNVEEVLERLRATEIRRRSSETKFQQKIHIQVPGRGRTSCLVDFG